jgi:hypothetical protein
VTDPLLDAANAAEWVTSFLDEAGVEDLDRVIPLLHKGIAEPVDVMVHFEWRMALSGAHSRRAQLTGAADDWAVAISLATDLLSLAESNPEDLVYAIMHTASVRLARLQFMVTHDAGNLLTEIDHTLFELRCLAAQLSDPTGLIALERETARLMSLRYAHSDDTGDLTRAADLFTTALTPHADDDPVGMADYWLILAELRREQFRLTEDRAFIIDAVHAIITAIDIAPPQDPDRPQRHQLLADLLFLRDAKDGKLTADDRDRILDHLAIASTGDMTGDDWNWYAILIVERSDELETPESLRQAEIVLTRCIELPEDTDENRLVNLVQLGFVHQKLFESTRDTRHADQMIELATRALDLPTEDHGLVQNLHSLRLAGAFADPPRPDVKDVIARIPVVEWIGDARRAVLTPNGTPDLATTGEVAFAVALALTRYVVAVPQQAFAQIDQYRPLFAELISMFPHLRAIPEMPAELLSLMDALAELMRNALHVLDGDGYVDFTAARAALANPELADQHESITNWVAMANGMLGSRGGDLRLLESAIDLLTGNVQDGVQPTADQLDNLAMATFFHFARHRYLGGSTTELSGIAERMRELRTSSLVMDTDNMLLSMVDFVEEVASVAGGKRPPTHIPVPPEGSFWGRTLVYLGRLTLATGDAVETGNRVRARELGEQLARADMHDTGMFEVMRSFAYLRLHELLGEDVLLDQAIVGLTMMVDELRQQRVSAFEQVAGALAQALRKRDAPGDRVASRELALELLRDAGWRVLLQTDPEAAMSTARVAVPTADQLAGWCVTDHAVEDLVRVVDARRGLVLRAANTGRGITQQLVALGRADLAERWQATGGVDLPVLPGDSGAAPNWNVLRGRVLRTLVDASDEMLDPPTTDELRDALRRHDADLLAYLLPATAHHRGMAVLVPADGPAEVLPLGGLLVGSGSPVLRYSDAYTVWDETDSTSSPAYQAWRSTLDDVCAWAWSNAAAQLLAFARRRSPGRDPRIVLVPVGMLGLVPWHAAYRLIGGSRRYLVEDATISYIPSGRMLCGTASSSAIEDGAAVLVGNPARNLADGAVEAKAIQAVFYPDGRFLGGDNEPPRPWRPSPDGAGTPEDVLTALRGRVTLLHLACHAEANLVRPLRSTIELAGTPMSARLSSAQLLDLNPTSALELGLVALAGCATQAGGVEYDEALSLSTTFLAIGARTVIGSLWRVPAGRATAQLMFMFHHHLNSGRPPSEALRHAQLWLLRPDRDYPATMPRRLRELPDRGTERAIESWAGFTHLGR